MNLFMIASKLWRYKLCTLPIMALTLCGVIYVVAVQAPVYQSRASFALLNPPPPPTAEEIARNPKLGRVDASNPYTRYADLSVLVQLLVSTTSSGDTHRALLRAGADDRFVVAPSPSFNLSAPIVQITALGPTPQVAIQSAKMVTDAARRQLDDLQAARSVDARYRVTALQIKAPDRAKLATTGKLRTIVGVLALGAIAIFILISILEALTVCRLQRWNTRATRAEHRHEEPAPYPRSVEDEMLVEGREANGDAASSSYGDVSRRSA